MRDFGFSLIELILVVAIVGVLAAALYVAIDPAQRVGKAQDAQRSVAVRSVLDAILTYTADTKALPTAIATLKQGQPYAITNDTGSTPSMPCANLDAPLGIPSSVTTTLGSWASYAEVYDIKVVGSYAYVANGTNGFRILDISNPAAPVSIGQLPLGVGSYAWAVDVVGTKAFIAEGVSGLRVIDISNPASPSLVWTFNTAGDARDVHVVGNYAFIADTNNGLVIVDYVNTYSNPVATYIPADQVFKVHVRGNFAYLAENYEGLDIVDIATIGSPHREGIYNPEGFESAARDVMVNDKHAYFVANGLSGDPHLYIINNSNPANPVLISDFTFDATAGTAAGLSVMNSVAYVANEIDGFYLIDISTPTAPQLVTYYDACGVGSTRNVFVKGQYLYGSCDSAGAKIVDVNGPPVNLASSLAPQYIESMPYDPLFQKTAQWTGYYIQRSDTNRIKVGACSQSAYTTSPIEAKR